MDSLDKYLTHIDEPQDTSVNQSVSSVLGAWQNLQIIFGQQVQRYIQHVNTTNSNKRRGVSISDINGLLAFLEKTINNTLSVSLKQQISISKLKTNTNKSINEHKTMIKKNTIRLNEAQLKRVVAESVKRIIREYDDYNEFDRQHGNILYGTQKVISSEESQAWSNARQMLQEKGFILTPEKQQDVGCVYLFADELCIKTEDGRTNYDITDKEWNIIINILKQCGIEWSKGDFGFVYR